jgi:hypothetical protein
MNRSNRTNNGAMIELPKIILPPIGSTIRFECGGLIRESKIQSHTPHGVNVYRNWGGGNADYWVAYLEIIR